MGVRSCIAIATVTGFLSAGCDAGGLIEISIDPDPPAGPDAGPDAGGHDGGTSGDAGASDAGVTTTPVLVGITPTAAASGGGTATPAEEVAAELTTFGAGARAAVVVLPWAAAPEAEDAAFSKRMELYAAHEKRVVLNLAVVDRLVDHRPAELADAAWNAPETVSLAEQTVDALFASSGDEVRYFTLGRDVDVYLKEHPGERAAFLAFAKQTFAYARNHPDRPAKLGVGVAFTPAAPKEEPAYGSLRDVGDVAVFSYFPALPSFEPEKDPGSTLVITQLADAAGSRPIVLQAAGLASAEAAGASDADQQAFFATLFGAIVTRRKSFALVNVVELYDAPPAACAAWAVAQGEAEDGPLAAYACSLGLLRGDGSQKPAWDAVLAGAAALSSP